MAGKFIHQIFDNGQSQTGMSVALGGCDGDEKLLHDLCRNAGAVIADLDLNVCLAVEKRIVSCRNRYIAALFHGLDGIFL